MTDVLATAADAAYGFHALNLVGSVKRNSDIFDRIEVFDLGLSPQQRGLLAAVPGVHVRDVSPFSPHWSQGFTWKPWAWTQVSADRVFWLDAGSSVLRSLSRALDQIDALGYFLVSQGNELGDIVPPDYFRLYGLPQSYAGRTYVAAGIIGFRPDRGFYQRIILPTYEDCLVGRNLGFSAGEMGSKNHGLGYMPSPPTRNCRHFRWDQTVLNARLALELPDAVVADLDEYGGWRSRQDHPRQVIWNHRRPARLRYLKLVPFKGTGSWRKRASLTWWELRWSFKLQRRLFALNTYELKVRAVLRDLKLPRPSR